MREIEIIQEACESERKSLRTNRSDRIVSERERESERAAATTQNSLEPNTGHHNDIVSKRDDLDEGETEARRWHGFSGQV